MTTATRTGAHLYVPPRRPTPTPVDDDLSAGRGVILAILLAILLFWGPLLTATAWWWLR